MGGGIDCGQVSTPGMVWGRNTQQMTAGAAVEHQTAGGATSTTFASEEDALAYVQGLPPSDADFVVGQNDAGEWEVRQLSSDAFKPDSGAQVTAHGTAGFNVSAAVFRDANWRGAMDSQVVHTDARGAQPIQHTNGGDHILNPFNANGNGNARRQMREAGIDP